MRATIGRLLLLLLAAITAVQFELTVDDGRAQGRIGAPENVVEPQRSTRCLVNGVRRRHHLPALAVSPALRHAAVGHSRAMLAARALSHQIPGEPDLVARAGAAGYLREGMGWRLGEVIGWGSADVATPRAMLRAWLRSPAHRSIVLGRGFRDMGVGVARMTDLDGSTMAYTIDFGLRRPAPGASAGHGRRRAGGGCDDRIPNAAAAGDHASGAWSPARRSRRPVARTRLLRGSALRCPSMGCPGP